MPETEVRFVLTIHYPNRYTYGPIVHYYKTMNDLRDAMSRPYNQPQGKPGDEDYREIWVGTVTRVTEVDSRP